MNHPEEPIPSLSQIEAEVLAEGREWTRRRLQERLQQLAEQYGQVFPPKPAKSGASASAQVRTAHRRRRSWDLGLVWAGSTRRALGLSVAGTVATTAASAPESWLERNVGL